MRSWNLRPQQSSAGNQVMIKLLESAPEQPPLPGAPTVKTVMRRTSRALIGRVTTGPQIYFVEVEWREMR